MSTGEGEERTATLRDKCAEIMDFQKQTLERINLVIGLDPEKDALNETKPQSIRQLVDLLETISSSSRYILRKIEDIERLI